MVMDHKIKHGTMTLFCDDISAINISKGHVQYSRTKRIDICDHFTSELVKDKVSLVDYNSTENQLVKIFTKSLDALRFHYLRKDIDICTIP